MKYALIIPTNAETAVTGFAMAAEKTIGKTAWRIEYWLSDTFPRVYRNGKAQASLVICPQSVIKFANAATQQFNALQSF